ncbi:intracellular protein transport protein USO1-like isoform X2 [Phalaenopsis equestris]|nr:intracellular protein transport protein USO1-like isoform X2 [Phalaenopsis equestris]
MELLTKKKHGLKWDGDRRAAALRNHGFSATTSEKKRFPSKRTVYLQTESSVYIEQYSSSSTISTSSSDSTRQHKSKENESISPDSLDDSSTSKPLLSSNETYKKEHTILDYLIAEYNDHQKSTNDWILISAPESALEKSAQIEKYRNQSITQTEELELSELELQNLVTTDSNYGEILLRKLNSLKGERDELKRACENLKATQKKTDNQDDSNKLHPHNKTPPAIEEIKQELQYEKGINANLRLQLHKMQEANSELILAVHDLEELLEQENKETICINCGKIAIKHHTELNISEINLHARNSHAQVSKCKELFETTSDGDNEQYKYLEDEIRNLKKEIEEQSKAYEANLENIMKARLQEEKRAKEAEERLQLTIKNNAIIAERLQEEFITVAREISSAFHMNEKLAIQALAEGNEMHLQKCYLENLLKQTKEEFTVLQQVYDVKLMELSNSVDSKTKEIEKLLENLKAKSVENDNQKKSKEAKLKVLTEEILMLENKVKTLSEEKVQLSEHIEHKHRSLEEIEQLKMFNKEIETKLHQRSLEKEILNSEVASMKEKAENSEKDQQKLQKIVKDKDIMIKDLNSEVKNLTEGSKVSNSLAVRDEIDNLKERSKGSNSLAVRDEIDNDLRKQAFHFQSDLGKREEKITILEKKHEENARSTNAIANVKIAIARNKTHKPGSASQGSKEVTVLREKIKLLEANLMFKNTELEETRTLFLQEEQEDKNLNHRIEELEKDICQCKKQEEKNVKHNLKCESISSIHNEQTLSTEVIPSHKREQKAVSNNYDQDNLPELLNEMMLLKENSKAMEAELNEMQQRYTEISLRFAEVEGERQRLVMTVRNLTNTLKT